MLILLGQVGIPYLALLAIFVIEGRAPHNTLSEKVVELGIDACVLGIGVSGAFFASKGINARLGEWAATFAQAALLLELIITGFCLHLRSLDYLNERARARLSIFFGVLILLIDTGVVLRLS